MDEQTFKEKLINSLNQNIDGWIDGDNEQPNQKTADIVNHIIKIVIEIKDDTKYRFDISEDGRIHGRTTNLCEKNRQIKNDLKDANKKFLNYHNYKSILLLRSEVVNFAGHIAEFIISGPTTYIKDNGKLLCKSHPSTFWGNHDQSTKEVGAILFMGRYGYYFRQNTNPNVNKKRLIEKSELEKIFGCKINDLVKND